ncbi:MAG: tetratricopeptide repeat protein [Deltaproteobacteria bacterium]|nr:tetratricopeptide repeat protein [Deltaproteobacteria bacterium]
MLGNLYDYETARSLNVQVMESRVKTLGPNRTDTLNAGHSLSASLCGQKDQDVARDLLLDSRDTATRIFGPRHPLAAEAQGESFGNLGDGGSDIIILKLSVDTTQSTGGNIAWPPRVLRCGCLAMVESRYRDLFGLLVTQGRHPEPDCPPGDGNALKFFLTSKEHVILNHFRKYGWYHVHSETGPRRAVDAAPRIPNAQRY